MELRTYTREFSLKMAKDILPHMKDEFQQPSPISRQNAAAQFKALWNETEGFGDTWDDAKLRDVARYLLGAQSLHVPKEWEWIIPSHL